MVGVRATALVAVLLGGLLLGGGTGCGLLPWACALPDRPAGLAAPDLVGDYTGDPFGALHLAADGTFRVTDWQGEIPREHRDSHHTTREREERESRTGHGEWTLHDPASPLGDLSLDFHQLDGVLREDEGIYDRDLEVGGSTPSPTLHQYLGDPDLCDVLTFTR
ncbi:hypothetical protein RM844_06680 [Streptomyces sp. DSM 44915]|uniref:Lipoprotein n=1 Tax=Streptomyces chisholmiae TaxID=3075540 RepID=A0ABU2JLW8_9ACTN|nr:hypothetical protein [Streptomyces sp. DSM 44915]MDT0265976.1 hypothetical protein [Streptomyces sp. DSM 44915]